MSRPKLLICTLGQGTYSIILWLLMVRPHSSGMLMKRGRLLNIGIQYGEYREKQGMAIRYIEQASGKLLQPAWSLAL